MMGRMVLVQEISAGLTFRLLRDDEAARGEKYVLVAQSPRVAALWLALGRGKRSKMLAAPGEIEGDALFMELIDNGCGLVGLPFARLRDAGVVDAQMLALGEVPSPVMQLDPGLVYGVRGRVFGHDLSRVPRAMVALGEAYVVEGPVPAGLLRLGGGSDG